MKRLIAKHRHKNGCISCKSDISKGNVYYTERKVYADGGYIWSYTCKYCAKCKYRIDKRNARFERFRLDCHHPKTELIWTYIPGECVEQPDHDECIICGKWL